MESSFTSDKVILSLLTVWMENKCNVGGFMNRQPINLEFYRTTKEFVIAALKLLGTRRHEIRYERVVKHKFQQMQSGMIRITERFKNIAQPVYNRFVYSLKKEMEQLPEYDACVQVMQSDPTIAKHLGCSFGTGLFRLFFDVWTYLSAFLIDQLWQQPNPVQSEADYHAAQLIYAFAKPTEPFEFFSETFEQTYSEIEQLFYNDNIRVKAVALLHFFWSEFSEIDLDKELRIRQTTIREREQLLDRLVQPSFQIPSVYNLLLDHIIEFNYETRKEFEEKLSGKEDVDPNERVNQLVTALRLFKTGLVGASIVKTQYLMGHPNLGPQGGVSMDSFLYKNIQAPSYDLPKNDIQEFKQIWDYKRKIDSYQLIEEEVPKFKPFWDWIRQIDFQQLAPVEDALDRFHEAYEQISYGDKLTRYIRAFEILFFRLGEKEKLSISRTPISRTLAVRSARLIANDDQNEKQIYKEMRSLYKKRSKLVHGEKVNITPKDIYLAEEHLRKSIKLFLKYLQTISHDMIISILNTNMHY